MSTPEESLFRRSHRCRRRPSCLLPLCVFCFDSFTVILLSPSVIILRGRKNRPTIHPVLYHHHHHHNRAHCTLTGEQLTSTFVCINNLGFTVLLHHPVVCRPKVQQFSFFFRLCSVFVEIVRLYLCPATRRSGLWALTLAGEGRL